MPQVTKNCRITAIMNVEVEFEIPVTVEVESWEDYSNDNPGDTREDYEAHVEYEFEAADTDQIESDIAALVEERRVTVSGDERVALVLCHSSGCVNEAPSFEYVEIQEVME